MKLTKFERAAAIVALMIPVALSTPAQADNWDLCQSEDPSAAITACSQIIETDAPGQSANLAAALVLRAKARTKESEYTSAKIDLDKAISLRPDNAQAYLARGRVHEENGDYAKAKADYDKAVRLFETALPTAEPSAPAAPTTSALVAPEAEPTDAPTLSDEGDTVTLLPPEKPDDIPAAAPSARDIQPARAHKPKSTTRHKAKRTQPSKRKRHASKQRKSKSRPKEDIRAKVNSQLNCSIAGGFNC